MANSKKSTRDEEQIELVWGSLSDIPTVYANQLLISHAGGEFYLVFGEFVAAEVEMEKSRKILIRPVAKIAMTPQSMVRMVEVIVSNVEKFKDRIEKVLKQNASS
jgi:hypothetical protein